MVRKESDVRGPALDECNLGEREQVRPGSGLEPVGEVIKDGGQRSTATLAPVY